MEQWLIHKTQFAGGAWRGLTNDRPKGSASFIDFYKLWLCLLSEY